MQFARAARRYSGTAWEVMSRQCNHQDDQQSHLEDSKNLPQDKIVLILTRLITANIVEIDLQYGSSGFRIEKFQFQAYQA